MHGLNFQITIDPDRDFPEAVNFRTGKPQSYDRLSKLFYALISGDPLPLTLGLHRVDDPAAMLAIAIFLRRDLTICPKILGVITSVELFCDEPIWGPGHIDRDFANFLKFLTLYVSTKGLDRAVLGDRVISVVDWIADYVQHDRLPQLPPIQPPPRILDVGTGGFVVAEMATGTHLVGWWDLFRSGYFRGILTFEVKQGRRSVTLARKSIATPLFLEQAKAAYEAVEGALGGSGWYQSGNVLHSPPKGTMIELPHLIEVAIRV